MRPCGRTRAFPVSSLTTLHLQLPLSLSRRLRHHQDPPPPPTPGIITRAALGLGYWCPEPRRREGQGRTTLPSKVRSRGQGQRTSHDCRDGFLCGKHTHVNEHSSWKSPLPIVNFQSLKSRHASGLRVLIGKIYFFFSSFHRHFFIFLYDFQREGGRGERSICCPPCLCIPCLLLACALTGDHTATLVIGMTLQPTEQPGHGPGT